ncbi:MAG TPA: class I adenylate-forming enzyme family protein [Beijerinckiaceae bacterium]|nr:class I adenylate-forming enzyme family protein [Beijerinckiaceae bacterium]
MTATIISWAAEFAVLASRFAERAAVTDACGQTTYAELFRTAAGLGEFLIAAGVTPGEPVATFLRNGRPAVWASIGVTMTGAAETALNPGLGQADREHCLAVSKARHVVTSAAHADLFRRPGLAVHCVEDVGEAALDPKRFPMAPLDAWGKILFTSGTTGLAKGVVYTQRQRWLANLLLRAALPVTPRAEGRLLLMTPFSHGASLMTYAYLDHGASVVLLDGADPEVVLPMIERGEVDEMFAPPTVLTKIVAAAGARRYPGLKTIFCGTAVLSPALYARAREIFGPVVRVTYGKSEVFNPIAVLEAAETDAWYREGGAHADACVGWPASGVEIEVRGEDGAEVPRGELGEVHIRARHMMSGYLRLDGYEPMRPDEFHATGDLGAIDARGRLHLVGRAADVIKTGGYKVAAEEVDRALAAAVQPGEIAAVGIPSEYWGEVIVVAVEGGRDGWRDRVEAAAREMTGYKRPRAYVELEALPRNAMAKVQRALIRDEVLRRYWLVDGPHPRLEPRPDP